MSEAKGASGGTARVFVSGAEQSAPDQCAPTRPSAPASPSARPSGHRRASTDEKGLKTVASNAKRKTTMAKLNRENAVRERRARKQARKDARRHAATESVSPPAGAPIADE